MEKENEATDDGGGLLCPGNLGISLKESTSG